MRPPPKELPKRQRCHCLGGEGPAREHLHASVKEHACEDNMWAASADKLLGRRSRRLFANCLACGADERPNYGGA